VLTFLAGYGFMAFLHQTTGFTLFSARTNGQVNNRTTTSAIRSSTCNLQAESKLEYQEPQIFTTFEAYSDAILPPINSIAFSVNIIDDLLRNADEGDVEKDEWCNKLATEVKNIRQSYYKLSILTPPPDAKHVQEKLLETARDCNDSTKYLVRSMETDDVDDARQFIVLLRSCMEKYENLQSDPNEN
jgi:hypothetical protein